MTSRYNAPELSNACGDGLLAAKKFSPDFGSDDEFYDRASKGQSRKKKEVVQKVETADSLLDQKATLTINIQNLHAAIEAEEQASTKTEEAEVAKMEAQSVDPLDQFMTQVSSTISKLLSHILRRFHAKGE
jgi:hypothetical protein